MSEKLWVAHQTTAKTFGPSRVSIDGCEYVDDFLNTLYQRRLLSIPSKTPITLYQPDGNTEIKPTDTIKSLGNMGKDGDAPLVVRSALIENGILIYEVLKSEGSPKRKLQPDTGFAHLCS